MMVIYLPVQFELDWTKHFRELEPGNGNFDGQTNGQKMDEQTYGITPISNGTLAVMVVYVPVKFEFDYTNRFRVKSPEMKMWMDKRTNEQTEFNQFRKEPSYDGELPPCQV